MAAARAGASVVVVAAGSHVGGMLTGGLSRTDVERQESLIGGLAAEVFGRIGASYGQHRSWRFEPHVAEAALRELLGEAGVEVVAGHPLRAATVSGRRIQAIASEDGCTFDGAVWVDATYEGDLLAAAGASWTLGREPRGLHGERWAGRQEMAPNPHQVRAAVPARDAAGRLRPGVVAGDAIPAVGDGDGRLQAMCYRLCLSRAPDRRPLDAPADYDRAAYGLVEDYLLGLVRDGITPSMHDVIGLSELPNGKVDVNSHGPFSTNLPGAGQAYPTADAAGRRAIETAHRVWAAGLLHFLATDATVPGEIQSLVEPLGYPPDEFVDDAGWPHQLYIRDARRLVGEHVLAEADILDGVVPGDTIAMAGYNIDIREIEWVAWPIPRFPDLTDEVLVDGYLSVPVRPYGIPYRSLVPRREEVANLLVAVCVSATAVAFASIRMEPQYLVLGHAAGIAAASAARDGRAVQDVDVEALRADLERRGQILRPPR